MFNPNTNKMMLESVSADCSFLGMVVADVRETSCWCSCSVGTGSITFCQLSFIDGRCDVHINGKIRKVNYKGSLEQLSHDVIAKVVKVGLTRFHNMTAKS
jgi:hypothetical protein